MKYLEYKGYTGSIEYSSEDNLLFGKVLGISGLISYEGRTGQELEKDFKNALEDYFDACKESEKIPEKPFKGSFNVRISPDMHQKAVLLARENKMSLNSFIAESLRDAINRASGIRNEQ